MGKEIPIFPKKEEVKGSERRHRTSRRSMRIMTPYNLPENPRLSDSPGQIRYNFNGANTSNTPPSLP
jgi:hypothetical protein